VIKGLIREARPNADDAAEILLELRRLILDSGSHQCGSAMRSWARRLPDVRIRRNFIAGPL
jgi:hypothetical protein